MGDDSMVRKKDAYASPSLHWTLFITLFSVLFSKWKRMLLFALSRRHVSGIFYRWPSFAPFHIMTFTLIRLCSKFKFLNFMSSIWKRFFLLVIKLSAFTEEIWKWMRLRWLPNSRWLFYWIITYFSFLKLLKHPFLINRLGWQLWQLRFNV